MRRTLSRSAFLGFLIAATLSAQGNVSGRWVLNKSKSDYGKIPAPDTLERTVVQRAATITIVGFQTGAAGDVSSNYTYYTDGRESTNKLQNGDSTGRARWEGVTLVIESSREVKGATLRQTERWTLSKDKKTLTVVNDIDVPSGKFQVKQVFDREAM
jgi:hypothetical protein